MTLIKTDQTKIADAFVRAVSATKSYGTCEAQPRLEAVLMHMAPQLDAAEKSAVWADLVASSWSHLHRNAQKLVPDTDEALGEMVFDVCRLAETPNLHAAPLLTALQISADDVMLDVEHWRYPSRQGGWYGYMAIEGGLSATPDFCAWAVRRRLMNATDVGLLSDAHELHMYRTGLVVRDDMERARNDRRWDDAE